MIKTLNFPTYTEETAPNSVQSILEQVKQKYGFVPNLLGKMAHAPSLLQGYLAVSQAFEHTSSSTLERQIILLVTSLENKCSYCAAAHTAIARNQQSSDEF